MWLLVARRFRPDAPYWPGRRLLAVADAVFWPVMWIVVFRHVPERAGLAGGFVGAAAVLFALERLRRALWFNHRYRFTTSRWGGIAAALLLIGAVLKLAISG